MVRSTLYFMSIMESIYLNYLYFKSFDAHFIYYLIYRVGDKIECSSTILQPRNHPTQHKNSACVLCLKEIQFHPRSRGNKADSHS